MSQSPPPLGPGGPGPTGPGPQGPVPHPPLSPTDERLWATLAHLSIPFVGFLGPLIIWLVFKDRGAWLREAATEALNFSILYTIAQVASMVLIALVIGIVLLPLIALAVLVLCILAAVAANRGEQYRYPVNLRIVK